jgi:lysozyme family protein
VKLTDALQQEYSQLFDTCVIRASRLAEVEQIVGQLIANRARYEGVQAVTGVPWPMVAVAHNMEAGLSFSGHLHNGDLLSARTVHVPAGRPKTGAPPFTWEASAADALGMHHLDADTDWALPGMLYQLEAYNGWGYRLFHPHVLSPYLWSASEHYTSGKYVQDGTWSDTAVSKQCGAAVLLRRLAERGTIDFLDQPAPEPQGPPLVVSFSKKRSKDPDQVAAVERLQEWLNTHTGIFVLVDGVPGPRTSDAFQRVTGTFLPGDPRG